MATWKSRSNSAAGGTGQRSRLFISGVERIERIGGNCVEVIFFTEQTAADGRTERIELEDSLIIPIDTIPDAIGKAMMTLGRQVLVKRDGTINLMQ